MSTATLQNEKKKALVPQLRFPEFEGEWELKKLGDIAKITTGSTPSTQIEEYYNGEKLFVSPFDIQENRYVSKTKTTLTELGFSKGRKITKGSVLFVCIGSTIGKVAQAVEDCLTNQQINALSSFKGFDNNFIYELLEKNGSKIKLLAGVQAVPQINKTDFSNFKYFIPTLPEQQKIASFLSAVDEKIQQLSRKKELLEQYKKGVMQQLFSQQLRFKDENGKDYPDWEEKKLGDLVTLMQSGISRMLSDTDIGLPILRSNNLQNGKIDINDVKYWFEIDNQGANLENYVLSEGDLLVNFINSIAQIGKVAMFSDLLKRKTIFTTNLLRLRFNEKVTSHFMINYFHLKKYEDYIQSITKPAVNQASFTTKDFRNFIINLPSLPEQQKIADFLSGIDAKIEHTNQQLTQAQRFKKGLLQQMFV